MDVVNATVETLTDGCPRRGEGADSAPWWRSAGIKEHLATVLLLLMTLGGGFFINTTVIATFLRHRLTRSPTNLLLLNLTVANLLLCCGGGGLLVAGLWTGHQRAATTHCGVYASTLLGLGSVSINTRAAIALER